jgi:membrane protein implicated in regulation of membrane protease activity
MGTQMKQYWFAWSGIGSACIAPIVQSFTPTWVFLTLIIISWLSTGIGLIVVRRRVKRQELEWKMEKAFGEPRQPNLEWTAWNVDRLKGGFK